MVEFAAHTVLEKLMFDRFEEQGFQNMSPLKQKKNQEVKRGYTNAQKA